MNPRKGSLADRLASSTAVLVVEDEPDIAGLLGAFFRASGLGLVHVNPSSADEVLAAIDEHSPSCVLLDIMLGGLSGLDVLAAIRERQGLEHLPVLIVSADDRPRTRKEAEGLGITAFVTKPFSVSALFDQVEALAVEAARADEEPDAPDTAQRLAQYVARAQQAGVPVSFALVRAGSAVVDVGRVLRDELPDDTVFGQGEGDEIAVIVPGTDARATTRLLAAALPRCGADVRAGVAEAPAHASTVDELYMAADAALAEAVEGDYPVVAAR